MWFSDDKLGSIMVTFKTDDFDRILASLNARYGDAEETEEPIQTNAGVTYLNKRAFWKFPDASLRLIRYASNINHGAFQMRGNEHSRLMEERRKKSIKRGADDL